MMPAQQPQPSARRNRSRLQKAYERGFLDARCTDSRRLVGAYSLWCWKLKVPLVWFERRTPKSRFVRIRLDMFTTLSSLTSQAQAEIQVLMADAVEVSSHDAVLHKVPANSAIEVAAKLLKAATRTGNTKPNRPAGVQQLPVKRPMLVEVSAEQAEAVSA